MAVKTQSIQRSSELQHLDLPITGMTCASCAGRIQKNLNKLAGVKASVNYALSSAAIDFDHQSQEQDLVDAITSVGYQVTLPTENSVSEEQSHDVDTAHSQHVAGLRQRLMVSAALSLPVLLISMVSALQFHYWQWFALQLATPVVAWGAWPFHRAAWQNLRHKSASMDTLISLGVISAFSWSMYALFLGDAGSANMSMSFNLFASRDQSNDDIYLEAAVSVTTFLLAGRYFEARAKKTAGAALKALTELSAKSVTVMIEGQEIVKAAADLAVGDIMIVRPGQKVATDGVIIQGQTQINQSMLTGESLPVNKKVGDQVIGACINVSGVIQVKATKVGADTALAAITELVTKAQNSKAPVQRLADSISQVFVPIVVVLSVLTLIVWIWIGASTAFAFAAAVSVLIVACPCALGLATPVALLVGTGRASQLGILIAGPEILEATRSLDVVITDKTGTITTGDMTVTDVITSSGVERDQAIAFAAALESGSEHPIAQAIVKAYDLEQLEIKNFHNYQGQGVSATVDDRKVWVGNLAFMKDHDIEVDDVLSSHEGKSQTLAWVAWDGKTQGLILISDVLKGSSIEAIKRLKDLGLRVMMLSGDNQASAQAVALQAGITEVIADVMPEGKVQAIEDLQGQGLKVAMIGDGINDAPALAVADLGLAIGTGTDVAIAASDITLVSGDVRAAADAISLSRRTLRIIRQNLFWAFAYNVLALPLAALGLLNPVIAGAAMAFSSVSVVINALRLRRFKSSYLSMKLR